MKKRLLKKKLGKDLGNSVYYFMYCCDKIEQNKVIIKETRRNIYCFCECRPIVQINQFVKIHQQGVFYNHYI